MKRRILLLVFGVTFPCVGHALSADSLFPSRAIRLIVPFSPGGGTDMMARTVALKLNDIWGQPVVVDNRAGGGGNIGTDLAAKSQPDGHTLLMGYVGNLAINPSLYRALPYDPVRDFAPVTLVATAPNVLVAHPSVKAPTVKDLVSLARTGAQLNYASAGNGTVGHMVAELFKSVTHARIVHVPYRGNGAAIADVLAGNVQLMFSAPGAVIQHVRNARLRALAITGKRRVSGLDDVSTFLELGYPQVDGMAWYGILAPARTSPVIVTRLQRDIARVVQFSDVKKRFAAQGYDASTSLPEEFAALIKADVSKWRKVVEVSGARVD